MDEKEIRAIVYYEDEKEIRGLKYHEDEKARAAK